MTSHFLVDKSLHLEAAWGGFAPSAQARAFAEPGAPKRYGPDHRFDLTRVDLHLWIDPRAPGLRGLARLQIRPIPAGLGPVVLDLDEVQVESVTDAQGHAMGWRHADGKLHIEGLPDQGGEVRVRYAGRPTRGLYFTGPDAARPERRPMAWTQCQDQDGHRVFPCIDHPSVKCPFSVTVTAPAGFEVVGNGRLAGTTDDAEGQRTWRWVQDMPIPAYLVTVVVAELTVVSDDRADIPLRYLCPAGTDEAMIQRVFGRTPQMVRLFSERFGTPYPWPRYDQVVVHDFIFGGMENAGATTLTELALTDERAAVDWDADDLIAHELAHQWFGDLVTCQDWSQGWLNEGWATWSETLWRAHDKGQEHADYELFKQLGNYLAEDGGRYRRPIVEYAYRSPIDLFDRHLYEKGGLVLHTLYHLLGDGPFWTGVRRYLAIHRGGAVHTRDFQAVMEQSTGRNLDRFFQQWVLGAGHPELTVTLAPEDGRMNVTVTQKQSGVGVAKAFHFPLVLRLVAGEQREEITLAVRERERTWSVPCPEGDVRVEVDADFRVLAALELKGPRSLLERSLAEDTSVVGRIRAARALAKEGSPQAIQALIDTLGAQGFWGVRAELAKTLVPVGGQAVREALIAALGDEHPKARRVIAEALGGLRHPEVADALARIATEGDASVHVEGAALRSLGQQRDPRVFDIAADFLTRNSWGEHLRSRALEALSLTRRADALPTLLAWTSEDRHPRVRAAAAAGLGRLADEVEGIRQDALERLIELAREAPFRVRLAAIGALGTAKDRRAAGALRRIHEADPDGRTARTAFEALRKVSAGRSADEALAGLKRDIETLRDDNRKLRDRVARVEAG